METLEYRERFRNIIINHIGNSEIWAFHPKYEFLLVSSFGRMKSSISGNIYKERINSFGYSVCSIPIGDRKSKSVTCSRAVAQTFLPYVGDDYEANHIDGNKRNNKLSNINWLTRQENIQHCRDSGLNKKRTGSSNNNHKYNNHKYSDSLIKEIAEFKELGYTYKELEKAYNIPSTYICTILKRRNLCQV